MRYAVATLILASTLLAPSGALAQVAQPGQAAQENAEKAAQPVAPPPDDQTPPQPNGFPLQEGHVPSYAAQPRYETVVRGGLREDDPIGDYSQPRWTAARLFPTTRIYVMPRGTVQLEYWLDTELKFTQADDVRFINQYELELGLGYRLQLDLYLGTIQEGIQGSIEIESQKIELRYAFADWGKIPTNPTLYLELARKNAGAPTLEIKVLLGDSFTPRLHWGLNLVFERDLGGHNLTNEYAITAGLSYSVVDRQLSLGVEAKVEAADTRDTGRFTFAEADVLLGPSLQWRPVPALHVDLVVLVGALGGREDGEMVFLAGMNPLLVIGWEL